MKQEIKNREALTIAAINKIWNKYKLSTKKVGLLNVYVMPISLYNCGTWALTKTAGNSLNYFYRNLLRRVVRVF